MEPAQTGERIRPIYPQTQGLSTRVIEGCVASALAMRRSLLEDQMCIRDSSCTMRIIDKLEVSHMMKQPIRWFFNRLGLGLALTTGSAHPPFSHSHLAYRCLQDEFIYQYLGTEHIHEIEQ